ncbi:hypothetical protein PMAYCL1PPCAC_05091 [Pristionchus mayeri]|uniref:UDP-glucuronosyltransferase n=1 Tax=Pristionchus mayeri TaxID=1317129 RepID=A0AAN5CBB4_9BILA|nr:hypothetical protein PMAYCL1PPCAC_05091 [Pristionchus mayeri]
MRLLLHIILLGSVTPFKFLAYSPQLAKSHVNFLGKISDVLIEAGHEVVILSPLLDSSLGFAGSKKARVIEVPQCTEARAYEEFMQNSNAANAWTKGDSLQAFFEWGNLTYSWVAQCNATIAHPGLLESLREEKFDVAFAEMIDFCAPGLFHLLGIEKWVITDSLAINDAHFFYTHTPSNPAYVPTMMGGSMGEEMSFSERFDNLLTFCFSKWFNEYFFPVYDEMFRTHDREIPSVEELFGTNSLVFTNSEPLVDFPRPSSARMIDIGGIVTSTGHKQMDADRISEGIPNLVETTWAPQSDLLHDPRISAFITHCGQGSITEAIDAGVPLIVVPIAYDQLRNAQQVKRNGHGIMLEKTELENPEKLRNAVKEVLENPSYHEKALKIKLMLEDRPFAMKEIFIRNMEFLAKYGPLRQLGHYGRKLNFFQYYLIDVIAAVLGVALVILIIAFFLVISVVRLLKRILGIKKVKAD